jgi:hypothetical protein
MGGLGGGSMGGGGGMGGLGGGSMGGGGGMGGLGGGMGGGMGGLGGGMGGGSGQLSAGASNETVVAVPAAGPAIAVGDTLLVMAQDGSLLAFDKTLGVDLTGPTVTMNWPHQGEDVCGLPPLEIVFQILDDDSGVDPDTIKIDIDGKPMKYNFTSEGFAVMQISDMTQEGLIDMGTPDRNPPLSDGRRIITVTASDYMGNVTTKKFTLFIDDKLPPLQMPGTVNPTNNPGGTKGGLGGPGGGGGGMGGPG